MLKLAIFSSSSVRRSSIIFRLSFGLHSIIFKQQKLESGSDDSGCVLRIKMVPEIFFQTKYVLMQSLILIS